MAKGGLSLENAINGKVTNLFKGAGRRARQKGSTRGMESE